MAADHEIAIVRGCNLGLFRSSFAVLVGSAEARSLWLRPGTCYGQRGVGSDCTVEDSGIHQSRVEGEFPDRGEEVSFDAVLLFERLQLLASTRALDQVEPTRSHRTDLRSAS